MQETITNNISKKEYTNTRGAKTMRRFSVILYSGEDGYILARCPELDNCMTQGNTIDEAIFNIKECIELMLEVQEDSNGHKFLGTFEVEV